MKILILGSGGREHALAWAVKRSQRVSGGGLRPRQRRHRGDCALRYGGFERRGRDGSPGRGRAARPDHRGAGGAALAGNCGCSSRARLASLRTHAGGGDAGVQQGLRQALPAAPQDSYRQLRGLHDRCRDRKGYRLLSFAHRGQGRRAARRQGRHHLRVAPFRHRDRRGVAERKAAGR